MFVIQADLESPVPETYSYRCAVGSTTCTSRA